MIALDIETSGRNKVDCGIWQIGAVDLITLEEFLGECRIDDEDLVELGAVKVHRKNENYLRNYERKSQRELLENFSLWVGEPREMRDFLCQGPDMDVGFIGIKLRKYGMRNFRQRSFDLHTIAQTKYHSLHGKFLSKGSRSDMDLVNILKFCGFKGDSRKNHNALEDAKLTGECFSRLIKGRALFPEYSKIEIPDYLI
jgi:DNA polymerase III epsilon subunit-like protein